MSIDFKVESQCNQACLKANKMLGLIKSTFVAKTPMTYAIARHYLGLVDVDE